jgi:hypothetical protein
MTFSERPTIVEIRPSAALDRHRRLLAALEAAFSVRFVASEGEESAAAVVIVGESETSSIEDVSTETKPVLAFAGAADPVPEVGDMRVLAHSGVDHRIRDIVLPGQALGAPLRPDHGEEPVATCGGQPVWTCRLDAPRIDRIAMPLPALADGVRLLDALYGPDSLGLIALVQFLRTLQSDRWIKPRLRSAFVIDDPNLRRDRYGYVDYRELVQHADRHGYHIAMAMIPLDARYWSKDAAALFRARPDRLSLVMHGNDHYGKEMADAEDFRAALAMAAQATRRIARFESKAAVAVDRVMMPPHEAWSRVSARAVGALGYAAMCAWQSTPTTGEEVGDPTLAGWTPATFVDGCAVVPRFPWWLDRTPIALRAFLDHPLILYGHHDDLASGLEPLAAAAAIVNSLGDVQWSSIGEIVHANHDVQITDETIVVRPSGRQLHVRLPDAGRGLTVVEPLGLHPTGLSGWTLAGGVGPLRAFGEPVPTADRETIVRLHSHWETDARDVASPPRSVPAIARRRLTEARARLAPVGRGRSRP